MFNKIEYSENAKIKKDDSSIVSKIINMWTDYDTRRSISLQISELMKDKLYLTDKEQYDYYSTKEKTVDNWQSKMDTNQLFSLAQTYKAFVKENTYKNMDSVFTVDGEDDEKSEAANIQKNFLVKELEDMGAEREFDKGIDYLISTGEMTFFTGWEERYKTIKRPSSIIPSLSAYIEEKYGLDANGESKLDIVNDNGVTATLRVPYYDGGTVTAIDPVNFVFDPDEYDNWDACNKILKVWTPISDIMNNTLYNLSDDCKDWLKGLNNENYEGDNKDSYDKKEDIVRGNQVEVLMYFGDLACDDKVYENWSCVVVGRKYLVLNEYNRYIINPFVTYASILDPSSKRGIPLLYSAYGLVQSQNKIMNDAIDISELRKNPPSYAPKGFFKQTINKIFPGIVREYDATLNDPNQLKPMTFDNSSDSFVYSQQSRLIAEVTGVYPNMQGQDTKGSTTATEIKVQVAGQTTRLQDDIDAISKYCLVPVVANQAELYANNRTGTQYFKMFKEGKEQEIEINDSIRQGQYNFRYNDRSNAQLQQAEFDRLKMFFTEFAQNPIMFEKIKWDVVFEEGLISLGVTNTQKYLKEDIDTMPNMAITPQVQQEGTLTNEQQFI